MSALSQPGRVDPAARRVPPLGGLNLTLFGIEVRRMLRNRRTVIFALAFPVLMYFIFAGQSYGNDRVGSGNVAAYILVNMALYGAALTAASIGAMVAVERAQGWSRQLRLTPLNPACYILVKAAVALIMGGIVVALVNVIAAFQGRAEMPVSVWVEGAVVAVLCTLTFAALGVFVGYIVPGENAMQILGPGLAGLSFLGGVFIPLSQYGDLLRHIAYWTPMYGVSEVARAPLTHELPWYAVANAVVWFGLFVVGAAWRMSKDTARG
ncbi:MAG: ABC transporter permease [Nocardioidaceae bacterium]